MIKSRKLLLLIIPLFYVGSTCLAFDFFQPVDPPRPFQVMVHRGMKGQAPENTRPAIRMLIEDHLDWAEVDVRLTKDGRHVIFHNNSLDGKTDGSGPVSESTLAEIEKLDAGSWFAKRYSGERILTLEDCLKLCKRKLNLYLDCKRIKPDLLVKEILDSGMEKQVVVYDDLETLREIRRLSKGRIAVMPKWRPEDGLTDWIDKVRPDMVEIDADVINTEICKAFHQRSIPVELKVLGEWDRPEFWDKGLAAGVDSFQTDLPAELIAHELWKRIPSRPVGFSLHRGGLRYAPENTIPAFEKAIRLGADYIEEDVRPSSDGVYFLLHDSRLDRTTNGSGAIYDVSADVVRGLDAGSWFGKPFIGVRVPTFEEFLKRVDHRVKLYCDAKSIPAADLADYLRKYGLVDESVVYQGVGFLIKLKKIEPDIRPLAPLYDASDIDSIHEDLGPYAFDTSWKILSKELIEHCHSLGIKVFSDAMGDHDTVEDHLQAMKWGIDVIQTDRPLIFLRALDLFVRAGGTRKK